MRITLSKAIPFILVFLFALHLRAFGQPSLTGLITSIRCDVVVDGDKKTKKFVVDLYLQLRNPSAEPLLVFRNGSFVGTEKLLFLSATGSVEDSVTIDWAEKQKEKNRDRRRYYYSSDIDFFERAVSSLEKLETPAESWFQIVPSEGYYEFRTSLEIESGFEIDEALLDKTIASDQAEHNEKMRKLHPDRRRDFRNSYDPQIKQPKSPYLQISYELSMGSYKKDPNLLRTLQTRWSKFGKMPLNGDNYYLKSDPIVISLPN